MSDTVQITVPKGQGNDNTLPPKETEGLLPTTDNVPSGVRIVAGQSNGQDAAEEKTSGHVSEAPTEAR